MGCDIHVHIEVKINGRWEHWSALNIERNYEVFARMAGVHWSGERGFVAIAPPRGFVPDPSLVTEIAWTIGENDWHTPSWLTGAELDELIRQMDPGPGAHINHPWALGRRGGLGYLFGREFDVKGASGGYPDGVEDCRIVFWFDN